MWVAVALLVLPVPLALMGCGGETKKTCDELPCDELLAEYTQMFACQKVSDYSPAEEGLPPNLDLSDKCFCDPVTRLVDTKCLAAVVKCNFPNQANMVLKMDQIHHFYCEKDVCGQLFFGDTAKVQFEIKRDCGATPETQCECPKWKPLIDRVDAEQCADPRLATALVLVKAKGMLCAAFNATMTLV